MRRKALLTPDEEVADVRALTPARLADWGLRGLILDADNTLVPRNDYHLDPQTRAWLEDVQAAGVKVCVLSNSAKPRKVAAMVAAFGIPALALARKPLRSGFRRALALLGTTIAETAMVGDQIFTDILGGNLMGLRTILVPPLSGNDFIVYRLLGRTLERPFLKHRGGGGRDG
jgi:hypothetical protein